MAYNVLITDDSPAMRATIRRVLEISPLDIDEIYEAEEAASMELQVDRHWVDLLILDLRLPDRPGVQMIERYKQDDVLNRIPIIALSADPREAVLEQAMDAGCEIVLLKPFRPEEIFKNVQKQLQVYEV